MTTVRCEVIEGTDQDKLLIMAVENLQRKDLSIVEEGEIFKSLTTAWSQRETAKKLGVSLARLQFAINAFTKLSPEVQQMVQSKELTEESTRALTKLFKEPEVQYRVATELAKEESNQFAKAKEMVADVKRLPIHVKQKFAEDETLTN